MRHFIRDDDVSSREQHMLISGALELKRLRGDGYAPLRGKSVAAVFEKESTRTRMSFEVGIADLGAHPVMIDARSSHLSRGESIGDTARVMSQYVDAIVLRTFGDDRMDLFASSASVPVINALTDGFHPCQLLADLTTITEEFGSVAGRTIAYLGDAANNMAHSYLLAGAMAGAHIRMAAPAEHLPDSRLVATASRLAASTGGSVVIGNDPWTAAKDADVLTTDTWVSMGQANRDKRLRVLAPFQLNTELLSRAADHAIVLHCLPAHRGDEITDDMMDGPASRVFCQAENRLHAQKALLIALLDGFGSLERLVS